MKYPLMLTSSTSQAMLTEVLLAHLRTSQRVLRTNLLD
jgi:hypothetical protein